ncbi:TonB-dependent receptor [Flavobacterium sp. UMI-01]|uniref:SusC/RagA family TonB-linked outer membrane protein n=1 Tax=Flavobacterium sp. UMI-01 TaxID=1441053 RepID=UPI001C7E1A49|nr:TonB-dependent receptor [Flavobacterium sp. UMI-01]GIZ08782.1 SusC/RagA family TonB-linked outer membrane protein [Flavobacterium sp. UMI-01]
MEMIINKRYKTSNEEVQVASRYYKLIVLFMLVFFNINNAVAQEKTITGIVVDNTGQPIPGAGVKVKKTTKYAATSMDGKYSIKADNNSVLQFSFVGFVTKEVTVGNKTSINVTLEEESTNLNEVVIQTGYGTTKKMDLAGSVSSVNVVDLQKAPVRSFEEALAGRVAGVQVIAGDGQPGDALNIVIRGNNSINNDNSPLYVIDGFPIEDPDNNAINPAEIETIDILKDASATSIYGSRGANGVIVITTKRGKVGAPTITYNQYYGFNRINRNVDLMNPYEFVRLQADINPTVAANTYFKDGKTLESYRGVEGADFQTKVFRPAAFQNHYLSMTGGTKDTRYSLSGSITDQDGIIINSGFKRYQGRATLDQQVNEKLKVGSNINYASSRSFGQTPRDQNNDGGNNVEFNLMYQIWAYRPITGATLDVTDLYDDFIDEELLDPGELTRTLVNPTASFQNEYKASFSNSFTGNLYAEYQFNKALKYRVTGAVNIGNSRNEQFYNSKTRRGTSPVNGVNGSIGFGERVDYSVDNVLTFDKAFNRNHRLTLTGVYTFQINERSGYGYSATNVQNENLGMAALGGVLNVYSQTYSNSSTYRLLSYAARASYQLAGGKYILGGTVRADGSSKFAPENRFGIFPSGSAAWRFSQEKFLKNKKWLSTGKLRASYGVVGNNRVNDFAYVSSITQLAGGRPQYYGFGGDISSANLSYFINSLGNEKVKWESTRQVDAGLEIGFYKDRFLLEVDYYKKTTFDLLLNSRLAPSVGTPANIIDNIGSISNTGLEFTLNTTNIKTKDFNWSTNFNISFNRNRIEALSGGDDYLQRNVPGAGNAMNTVVGYISQIGKPITAMYGFVYEGNYQVEDFNIQPNGTYLLKPNIPYGIGGEIGQTATGVQPGDPKYRDVNGDGLVNNDDKTIIGNPFPVHIGGLSNNFRYKQFDLNVFMQWSYGNDTYNANRLYLEGGTVVGLNTNQFASYADRWTEENRSNTMFRTNATGVRVYSTRFVEDASFIRLKTVQLGYNFTPEISSKLGLKSLRMYVSAQNLITWTNYSSTDPENSTKGNTLTAGYDFSAYPRALTVTAGFNLSF